MTTHSRPRQSILSLFDPLASTRDPSTPPRNDSPGAESDKENENPPRNDLTLSTFFNRTYKTQKQPDLKPLRRRLVDVGDVTVDDVDPWLLTEEIEPEEDSPGSNDFEDNENDTLTFRQMAEAATPKWNPTKGSTFSTPSPSAPRTPLSELAVDEDATPMAKGKTSIRQQPSGPSKLAQVESPQIVVSNADSPQRRPLQLVEHHQRLSVASTKDRNVEASPGLSVPPNLLANSASSVHLPSSSVAGSLIADTVIPGMFAPSVSFSDDPYFATASLNTSHLRPNHLTTSSNDQGRFSMDLQSSFQLHMGDEPVFDLLNDKISFFAASSKNGMGSYLDDDPSFEMSFGDSLPMIQESEDAATPSTKDGIVLNQFLHANPTGSAKEGKEDATPVVVPPNVLKGAPCFTELHQDSHFNPSCADKHQSSEVVIVTPKHSKVVPTAPPPIIGLRIVKRSQVPTHKPSQAVSSPKVILGPGTILKKPSVQPIPSQPREPSQIRRTISQAAPSLPIRIRNESVNPTKPTISRTSSIAASTVRTGGPRRVLITEEPEQRTVIRNFGGGSTASLQAGPRRVPTSEKSSVTKGSMSEGGRKQATAASSIPKAFPTRTNVGSSLPQPTARPSRLPAPSAAVRGLPGREGHRGIPSRRII